MNYGLRLKKPSLRDYKFGAVGNVIDNVLVADGNWYNFLPRTETQISVYLDTMACVTFSALNVIEAVFNRKIETGAICGDNLIWLQANGYIENGKVNFSDRFIAKVSETNKSGNYLYKVGDAIRNFGLVPEMLWDYPVEQRTPVFDWDDYYTEVSQELLDLGQEFLQRFNIVYEVVYANDFDIALQYSPIQVLVIAWYKKDGLYYSPDDGKHNHAVIKYSKQDKIFDSYDPYNKQLTANYNYYNYGYKYNVTNININPMTLKENNLYLLVEGGTMKSAVAVKKGTEIKFITGEWDDILKIFYGVTKGDTANKVISVGLSNWNSVDHYDTKLNRIN